MSDLVKRLETPEPRVRSMIQRIYDNGRPMEILDPIKIEAADRIRKLEAALKLGWKVAIGTSYDGACDCATCAPVREFLKTVEALTAAETTGEHPNGGPCIHVWALTNRSAVVNGKCELCGNTVKIKGDAT